MDRVHNQDFPRAAFVLCVFFYALLVAIGFNDMEEDAFIYFRFASNIADGYGYVFNIGGEHIEACSGLLWLGMITLLTWLPIHIVLSTKLLCFVFGVLCIRQVFVLSQRFIADRHLAMFPAFLMVVSIPFYTWSVRGLETALYWFVMLWLVDWVTNPVRIRYWWLPAIALLNARPEGFLMLGAVLPYLFFIMRSESGFWRGSFLVAAGWLTVMLWRFWYFHDLVPHPFYFKVNPDHAQSLRNLFTYGWHSGWALLLLLALPGVWKSCVNKSWVGMDLALCGALFFSLLWAVFVFEDKVYNRHTGIALPFFYIFTVMLLARWSSWRWLTAGFGALLAGLVLFTLVFSRYVHFRDSHLAPFLGNTTRAIYSADTYWPMVWRLIKNPDDFIEQPDGLGIFDIRYNPIASVGDFVRLNYRGDAIVVYDQIGQAPWYAGRQTFFIDNLGLGYREIGLAHFHKLAADSMVYSTYEKVLDTLVGIFWPQERRIYSEDEIISRILEINPDVIVARKSYIAKGRSNILTRILNDPAHTDRYQARYLLNKREIFFERVMDRQDFRLLPGNEFIRPPGAVVKTISSFAWCDGAPCLTLEEAR